MLIKYNYKPFVILHFTQKIYLFSVLEKESYYTKKIFGLMTYIKLN